MSIFKPKKGINAKPNDQAYDPNDPLSGPMGGPMIKQRPAETKPVTPVSQTSPPKQYSAPQTKTVVENDILSQRQPAKPEPKENPVVKVCNSKLIFKGLVWSK